MCVSFTISLTLLQLPNLELLRFATAYKIYEWGVKTNIACSFIRGMVENYCTLSKIQP